MRRRAVHLAGALVASASLGLGAVAVSSGAGAGGNQARATLYSTSWHQGGHGSRSPPPPSHDGARASRRARRVSMPSTASTSTPTTIPTNGEGCVAPTFASADGHWRVGPELHGHHLGDMPSVYVNSDGSVDARFTLDRINGSRPAGQGRHPPRRSGQLRQRPARSPPTAAVLGELARGGRGHRDDRQCRCTRRVRSDRLAARTTQRRGLTSPSHLHRGWARTSNGGARHPGRGRGRRDTPGAARRARPLRTRLSRRVGDERR